MLERDVSMFEKCLADCATAALVANGIPVSLEHGRDDDADSDAQVAAFIGFGGEQIRGTLVTAAPLALGRAAFPVGLGRPQPLAEDDVLDWFGEIVNQMLGRVTNVMVGRGIHMTASIPKAVQADKLWVSRSTRTSVCGLRLRAPGGSIGVWLDAVVLPGVELFAMPPTGAVSAAEGDVLLFDGA